MEEGETVIRDLNGNGTPDMPMLIEDDAGSASLAVFDGQTRERAWEWTDAGAYAGVRWHGFFKFLDNPNRVYAATHLVLAAVTAGTNPVYIIDLESGAVAWQMEDALLFAVADLDRDDRPELLLGDRTRRQVVLVR